MRNHACARSFASLLDLQSLFYYSPLKNASTHIIISSIIIPHFPHFFSCSSSSFLLPSPFFNPSRHTSDHRAMLHVAIARCVQVSHHTRQVLSIWTFKTNTPYTRCHLYVFCGSCFIHLASNFVQTLPPLFFFFKKSLRSGKKRGHKGIDKGQGKVSSPEYLVIPSQGQSNFGWSSSSSSSTSSCCLMT